MERFGRLVLLALVLCIIGVGLGAAAQSGDYFANYPGGTTEAAYEIHTEELGNPITLGWRVEPAPGGQFTVTTTNRVTASREELELGVANGVAQAQLIIQDEAVRALLENRRSLGPHATFVLPGGARFTTAARETIQGVSVICGMLVDPDRPDRRTFLAITQDPTLPFPPFAQMEQRRASGGTPSSLPVCASLGPLAAGSTERYAVLFRMALSAFSRQP